MPFKQRRQPMQGRTSSARPAAALLQNSASHRLARPAVQAAQAADAGANLLGAAGGGLVAELGVAQVGAAHHADIRGAVLDELLGDPGLVDAANGGHGNAHVLLDLTGKRSVAGLLGPRGGNRGAALDGGAAGDVDQAIQASLMRPTVATGMPTCFLISRESAAWLACLVPAAGIAEPRLMVVPPETWIMSTPAFSRRRET